jgi:hypothetical protein
MATSDFDVVDQVLEECTTLEYILLGDLRDLLEEAPDDTTSHWLRAVTDALLETLPRELELKKQGGYLAGVLEQYPSWSAQVDELRREKYSIYRKLETLRDQLEMEVPFAEIAEAIRRDLKDWMTRFQAHQRHERRIVQTAFNLEVGTGD